MGRSKLTYPKVKARWRRAARLTARGLSITEIAARLGVTYSAAWWMGKRNGHAERGKR